MKKYLALISALAISLTMFTSCGDSKDEDNENKNSKTTSVSAADSEAASEEESSEPTLSDEEKQKKTKAFDLQAKLIYTYIATAFGDLETAYGMVPSDTSVGDYKYSNDDIKEKLDYKDYKELNLKDKNDVDKLLGSQIGKYTQSAKTDTYKIRVLMCINPNDSKRYSYVGVGGSIHLTVFYSDPNIPIVGVYGYDDDEFSNITDIDSDEIIKILDKANLKIE